MSRPSFAMTSNRKYLNQFVTFQNKINTIMISSGEIGGHALTFRQAGHEGKIRFDCRAVLIKCD